MFTDEQGQDAHVDRWKHTLASILYVDGSFHTLSYMHFFDNDTKDMSSLWFSSCTLCSSARCCVGVKVHV